MEEVLPTFPLTWMEPHPHCLPPPRGTAGNHGGLDKKDFHDDPKLSSPRGNTYLL